MEDIFADVSKARQADIVGDLLRKTKSCGIASAIFKADGPSSWVDFIGYRGIPAECLDIYKQNKLFDQDPFLNFARERGRDLPRSCSILNRNAIACDDLTGDDYRYFMKFYGMNIVSAAIMPLQDNIFLSLCLHSSAGVMAARDGAGHEISSDIHRIVTDVAMALLGRELADSRRPVMGGVDPGLYSSVKMSNREREIVDLVCAGMMNKQIAYEMGISVNSVENNLRRVFKKFDVQNRSSLINRYRGGLRH